MTYPKQIIQLLILIPILTIGLSACNHDEEEETSSSVSCSYQVSKTGCNNSTYSSYTSKCSTFSGISLNGQSPTSYCQGIYPATDLECVSTCCVKFRFKNVSAAASCSGAGNLAGLTQAPTGDSELKFEASWAKGDVDLEMLTPMRKQVSSQNPQADGCTFSGDDRYVLNGPVESVQCQGVYLSGGYVLILSNYSAGTVAVNVKVTRNGEVIHQQQLSIAPGEPQSHSISVQ